MGKKTEQKIDTKKKRYNRSSALGGLRAVLISCCDTLMTYTALFNDGARKHKRRKKIPCNKTNFGVLLGLIQLPSI